MKNTSNTATGKSAYVPKKACGCTAGFVSAFVGASAAIAYYSYQSGFEILKEKILTIVVVFFASAVVGKIFGILLANKKFSFRPSRKLRAASTSR